MLDPSWPAGAPEQDPGAEVARLNKIVRALMDRIERSSEMQNSDFSLFQATILLEEKVRRRTEELEAALRDNEIVNRELQQAHSQMEREIQEREFAQAEVLRRNAELIELNNKLSHAHEQLLQSEKLASIGLLAAGVAHEINNPIGYIFSNFNSLNSYLTSLFDILDAYKKAEPHIAAQDVLAGLQELKKRLDLDFLKEDIVALMCESQEGIVRVRKIVQDLKEFSHVDSMQDWGWMDLHKGIDSTLNIINNEIKYKADVVKHYGKIPEIECISSQINQVIMNVLVNAAHAIGNERGRITIRTGASEQEVWLEIEDTGCGIPKESLSRIFDPFYTTKPAGKGTGLGLSLSYGIIHAHHGRIEVQSEVGKGTTFRIILPARRDTSSHADLNTKV
jgi:two-component system, NtrC family, sensor kinase